MSLLVYGVAFVMFVIAIVGLLIAARMGGGEPPPAEVPKPRPMEPSPPEREMVKPKFEMYEDKAGEYRFRLIAPNGEIIGVSEGYKTMTGCRGGIDSVKRNAPSAEIEDLTA